jgi:uncharacterized protein with HEPN domain
MLPSEKNDLLYLLNILEYIGKIWKYTEKVKDAEELYKINDQMNLNASFSLLSNISENISKTTDKIREEYPSVEWKQIRDFRNRIVHDYAGIDLAIIYEIITQDLKMLKLEIEKIIKEKLKQEIFDIEEIKVCKQSPYYEYIEFEKII